MRVIELNKSVTESNDRDADQLRAEMKKNGTLMINLMSSPGSGKTTLLSRVITDMKEEMRIGVMEADIASDVDALRIEALGARAIQAHTDGMCHMDAGMTERALRAMGDQDLDLGALRTRFTAQELLGLLACSAGMIEQKTPVSLEELISVFSWEPLKKDAIYLDNGLFE